MKKIFTALPILILANPMYAKSNTERIGDILSVAIPVGAYGATLYLDDEEGEYQFYKSYGTTLAATYALKYTVREKRPDSDNTDSFPSGHTSSAFSGAGFSPARIKTSTLHLRLALTTKVYSLITSGKA